MSAYFVEPHHIAFLAALRHAVYGEGDGEHPWECTGCEEDVEKMIEANLDGMRARYGEDSTPHDPWVIRYDLIPKYEAYDFRGNLAQVARSIGCFNYQACEDPSYEDGEVWRMLRDTLYRLAMTVPKPTFTVWGAPDPLDIVPITSL